MGRKPTYDELEQGLRALETAQQKVRERISAASRLGEALLLSGNLPEKLHRVADGVVRIFEADLCRIWTIQPSDLCDAGCFHADVVNGLHVCGYRERCLHLAASSGRYTHLDGRHGRVPFDAYRIGRIASGECATFLTNDVLHDPRVHDRSWAEGLGLVSFAGYRLPSAEGNPVGVLALFSTHPVSPVDHDLLQGVANAAAQVIQTATAEEALHQSEVNLREAQRMGKMGHWAYDLETQRLTWSDQVFEIFGRDPSLGPPDFEESLSNYYPEHSKQLQERSLRALQTGEGFEMDYKVRLSAERTAYHFSTFHPIKDPAGRITRFMGTIQDITERKQAEAEREQLLDRLRQAQKMEAIGTLAGGIAHDFNNVLTAIIGYTELAIFDSQPDTLLQANLRQLLQAGKRGRDLVEQILAFSRQAEQEVRPVDLRLVVREALRFLRASLPTTIELRQSLRAESCTILGDPTQMHQILVNLCTNAADAMEGKGGLIEVTLVETDLDARQAASHPNLAPGEYLRLAVRDTGHGMESAVMDRIFDPFFTTKERGKGTGMGLSVVHGIVRAHGGHIGVHSEPEKGTEFCVLLPRIAGEAPAEREEARHAMENRACILFVDDEEVIVHMRKQMLERLGHEVHACTSGVQALGTFRAQPDKFDLVITDMTMPHMTGVDLSRQLLEIRPNIPIVLCTGFSEQIDLEKARKIGIQEMLIKPVLFNDLCDAIERTLA